MHHRVHRPGPPLNDVVDALWVVEDAPAHTRERIVPSGTVELVINLHEDEFRIGGSVCRSERRFRGAVASGCYSTAFDIDTRAHARVLGVHFKPGGAGSILAVPPGEFANDHVGLDDLWGSGAAELRERLCAAASDQLRFQLLEEALVARMLKRPRPRRAVCAGLAELTNPRVNVGHIAEKLNLSRRRFIEVFTEDVGMTPKRYSMVRRFQCALALASRNPPAAWTQIARACGYFDQAHLCRDWADFTGMSPGEFLASRAVQVKEGHIALPEQGVKSVQDAADGENHALAHGTHSHRGQLVPRATC